MPPANPQSQPAADDSANAVTEIAARVEAAKAELQSIIDTKWSGSPCTAFRMRIPAQETDSDIVIGNALSGLETLLAALTREREALAAMSTRALAAEGDVAMLESLLMSAVHSGSYVSMDGKYSARMKNGELLIENWQAASADE